MRARALFLQLNLQTPYGYVHGNVFSRPYR